MEIEFEPAVTPEQAAQCAALAGEIWREHYGEFLGERQIAYMLEKFQSAEAIARQIETEGYRYMIMRLDGSPAGYFAWRPDGEAAFLSKLYVRREARGRGLARAAVERIAKESGCGRIWLTVNRENSGSIAAYKKMGFTVTREQCADIGGGFVMDDYIMEKRMTAPRGARL